MWKDSAGDPVRLEALSQELNRLSDKVQIESRQYMKLHKIMYPQPDGIKVLFSATPKTHDYVLY